MGYWDTQGQSDEWYTPPQVFAALGCRFDLDAAPARYGTAEGARTWLVEREQARRNNYETQVALAIEKGLAPPSPYVPAQIPDALPGSNVVPADRELDGDGLTEEWSGFVWLNPPFGGRNGIEPWLDRFFAHGNGVALTPDRTSAPWFWRSWVRCDAVLFTRKIRFVRPDGSEGVSPSNGTALFAAGDRATAALSRASRAGFGILGIPSRAAA